MWKLGVEAVGWVGDRENWGRSVCVGKNTEKTKNENKTKKETYLFHTANVEWQEYKLYVLPMCMNVGLCLLLWRGFVIVFMFNFVLKAIFNGLWNP